MGMQKVTFSIFLNYILISIYVGNVDSTHICAYLRKSCYVCYLPYLPSPIPTPISTPPTPAPGGVGWGGDAGGGWGEGAGVGGGGDGGGDGAWEVGEVVDVARLA